MTAPGIVPSPEPAPTPAPSEELDLSALGVPAEIIDNPALAPHFSPEGEFDLPGALKSLVSAQQLIGGDRIPIPKADAPPEQWGQFFDRLGRPKDAAGYELKNPEGIETVDEARVQGFREIAHKIGLSGSQAAALYEWQLSQEHAADTSDAALVAEARTKAEALMRQEFGQAYEQKIQMAQRVIAQFGGAELSQLLNETGLGNHPAIARFAIKIGETMSEDTLAPGINGPGRFGMTPAAAAAELSSLMRDPAYLNPQDPNHAALVEKIGKLSEAAFQEVAAGITSA